MSQGQALASMVHLSGSPSLGRANDRTLWEFAVQGRAKLRNDEICLVARLGPEW